MSSTETTTPPMVSSPTIDKLWEFANNANDDHYRATARKLVGVNIPEWQDATTATHVHARQAYRALTDTVTAHGDDPTHIEHGLELAKPHISHMEQSKMTAKHHADLIDAQAWILGITGDALTHLWDDIKESC